MSNESRILLTIITEAALEAPLCADLDELGATGYTITNARGRGNRGIRDAGWSSDSNIRIEIVCDEKTSDRIVARVRDRYYDDYAMILFISDVRVLRPQKF